MTGSDGGRRPALVVAVTGAATDAGKTWVAAAVLTRLRAAGLAVSARKPVQSFEVGAGATDADVLAGATGEDAGTVCPRHRWYPLAMAPPIAARRLGRNPIRLGDLVAELDWPAAVEVGVVETVGGVRSPVADDGDSAALVHAIGADHVILVADAGLGAINAVRLAAGALRVDALTVMLNWFDGDDAVHASNRAWLTDRDGFSVVTQIEDCVAAVRRRLSIGRDQGDGTLTP